jgi:hypothetical protein
MNWQPVSMIPGISVTTLGPALATHRGKLYVALREFPSGRVVINTNTSSGWGTPVVRGGRTVDTPALGLCGDSLYCAVRGEDDRIWLSSLTGASTTWSDFQQLTKAQTTFSGPAVASTHTGDLYITYRASDF